MAGKTAATDQDYSSWSNYALVERVHRLEQQLRAQNEKELSLRSASVDSLARLQPPKKKVKSRKQRAFNPDKYNTRFIALKIAYLGQSYNGFEAHLGNVTPLPTIEEVLWNAMVKTKLIFKSEDEPVNWDGCEYSKCGRTDKGVSAFGQVIGLRVRSNRPKKKHTQNSEAQTTLEQGSEPQQPNVEQPFDDIHDELPYPHLLNRVLPPDVRVLAWCPHPPAGFSARFSCRQRKYRYFFTQPAWSPAPPGSGLTGSPDGRLDINAMSIAAKKYEGLHDFRNFCKIDPARQLTNFERRIEHAEVVRVPDKRLGLPFTSSKEGLASSDGTDSCVYSFDISGSAFLWHQVRHLVAVLFLVGQGFEKPGLVDELLDVNTTPRKPVYDMADDRPLVLWDCIFPASDDGPMVDALEWVYPGDQKPTAERYAMIGSFGEGRYGPMSITEVLWNHWHDLKIDEVLAGELLDISQMMPLRQAASAGERPPKAAVKPTARLFDGSGSLRSKGQYLSVMKRDKIESPEVLSARWLENNKHKARKAPAAPANVGMNTT